MLPDLKFRWEDGEKSVQMSPDVALPQFNILGHRQRIVEASLSSGNYSRLLADVQFDRALGYYVIQVSPDPHNVPHCQADRNCQRGFDKFCSSTIKS